MVESRDPQLSATAIDSRTLQSTPESAGGTWLQLPIAEDMVKAARLPRIILRVNVAAIQSDILQLKSDSENPTGGALETQVGIHTLEEWKAVAQCAGLALRALGDVENALAAGQALADRDKLLQCIVADMQRALAPAQTTYRVGIVDL
jgi:outer membrane protein, multidrug efflux system